MGYQRAVRLKGVVFLATLCYLCHFSLGRGVSAYNSFLNDEVESSPRGWLEQASVSNPDCVLSACKFGGSTVLKPNEWRAGDCHHNIPKYTTFDYQVQGNVSIYLFTKGAMFDFKRGGKISSLLPDIYITGRPDVTNGTYSFSKAYSLDDDGIFFVVYNDRDEDVAITFQAAYIVNPVPSHQDLPCSNFTSRQSCESTMNGDNTCVWCANPCSCMSIVSAEDHCDSGWDARLLTGTINVPGFSFDAWGYFAVILGGVIVIFVVGLFVAEFSIGVYNFFQKRKQYRKKDSSDDYAPLLTN